MMKQKCTKKTLYTSISTIYLGQISAEHVPHWCRQNCLLWAASSTPTWPGDHPPLRTPKEWMKSDASHAYGMSFCFGRQAQVHTAPHQGPRGQGRMLAEPDVFDLLNFTFYPEPRNTRASYLITEPMLISPPPGESLGKCFLRRVS